VGTNPYLVVFLTSIVGNMIPFFPVPYLLLVIGFSATFPGLSVLQIAAVSALGASLGKFVSYGLGYGARQALGGSQARFDSFRKFMGGSSFLVAFVFAASPFPDDIIFIPLGIIRYSPIKTFLALYGGKFVLPAFFVFVDQQSQNTLEELLGGNITFSILSIIIVILVTVLLMRVDWEKVLVEGRKGALRRALGSMLRRPKRTAKEGKAHSTST